MNTYFGCTHIVPEMVLHIIEQPPEPWYMRAWHEARAIWMALWDTFWPAFWFAVAYTLMTMPFWSAR